MDIKERGGFGSKFGLILASAGSAVGLGNIWRFPTETGENGGAAFILVYLLCVIFVGLPVMISEFIIGRHSKSNTATAYKKLSKHKLWQKVGHLGVLTGFLILAYYNVVAGWTLDYTVQALLNNFNSMAASGNANVFTDYFNNFISNPWKPVIYLVVFMLFTHYVITRGVKNGIERFSKMFMPTLFVLLIILLICSLLMPGAYEGLSFLFSVDFAKITPKVFLAAMGQAFFTLSIGMGCLCTYASYFKSDANLGKTAISVAAIDTCVAIMAGMIIFPAVFSVPGLSVDAGPSLIFIALPNIFQSAFGNLPILSYIFSLLFYFLLVLATLTSTISLHEVVTAYISEVHHLSRKKAATIVTAICIILGVFCSLSMGVLKENTIAGMTLFDLFDYITAKWMLPIGGMLIAIFTGWALSKRVVYEEMTNVRSKGFPIFPQFFFLLKFISPLAILLVFLNELGLFSF